MVVQFYKAQQACILLIEGEKMRNKRAKMIRKGARIVSQHQGNPQEVAYDAWHPPIYDARGRKLRNGVPAQLTSCVRSIYQSFKKQYKGKGVKKIPMQ